MSCCIRAHASGKSENGSALLETVIVVPLILLFLAGLYTLTDLAVTSIHLTHAARLAAREYILHKNISLCRAVLYKSIDNGGSPLEIKRLKVYLGDKPKDSSQIERGKKEESLLKKFLAGAMAVSAGTKLTVSYRWGGVRLFGLEIAPFLLEQNCTILAGTWSLCSD